MSTAAERLAQLEMAEFDTFGAQDAGPGQWPLATPEEVAEIREVVFEAPWTDPARFPECLALAFDALGVLAVLDNPTAHEATQALRRMLRRAKHGGPLDEDRRFQGGEA